MLNFVAVRATAESEMEMKTLKSTKSSWYVEKLSFPRKKKFVDLEIKFSILKHFSSPSKNFQSAEIYVCNVMIDVFIPYVYDNRNLNMVNFTSLHQHSGQERRKSQFELKFRFLHIHKSHTTHQKKFHLSQSFSICKFVFHTSTLPTSTCT